MRRTARGGSRIACLIISGFLEPLGGFQPVPADRLPSLSPAHSPRPYNVRPDIGLAVVACVRDGSPKGENPPQGGVSAQADSPLPKGDARFSVSVRDRRGSSCRDRVVVRTWIASRTQSRPDPRPRRFGQSRWIRSSRMKTRESGPTDSNPVFFQELHCYRRSITLLKRTRVIRMASNRGSSDSWLGVHARPRRAVSQACCLRTMPNWRKPMRRNVKLKREGSTPMGDGAEPLACEESRVQHAKFHRDERRNAWRAP